jgi:hypothetical protein
MNDKRPGSSLAGCLAVAALLFPLVYVLLLGPAVWLHDHGYLGDSLRLVYAPLHYLHEHCEPARQALEWYVALWGV